MDKNILILNDKHHSNLGGTETYTKNLVKIFTDKGYKVFEINFFGEKNNFTNKTKNYEHVNHKIIPPVINLKKLKFNIFKFSWNTLKFYRLINKTIKSKKINIIIDNTIKSIPYSKKKKIDYIWIANFDIIKLYNEQKKVISKFIRWMALRQNKFKYKKIVLYTQKDKEALLKINKKINPNNIFTCPLSHKNLTEMNNFNFQEKIDNAKNIVYMGRLDQNQKNINFITKIAEKLNNLDIYIYIYGDGEDKNLIIDKPGIKYQGSFKKEEVDEILKNAKILILPSFFEGFGYVIVEALSNGVPCLVANSFINASYLINDERGKCINNFDMNYWVNKIKFFQNLDKEDYLRFSKNALNFAKENLTNEKFKEFWIKLL